MRIPRLLICLLGLGLGTLLFTSPYAAWSQAPGKPSIYEFGSKVCPYCREMARILKDVESQYPGQVSVRSYYIETDERLFEEYRVSIRPTLVFVDLSGQEVYRHEGLLPKEQLVKKLKELEFIRD
jgi:thiol-disulfide isomerase/thioredoxin